ncbi:unnamed protein product [Sphagnum troendelagicum]|uniref:Protein XRI1 n=1 Tax=Sphagnum troendelagicum TaxID=128251 RepID=A0ABP0TU51_9BRYO
MTDESLETNAAWDWRDNLDIIDAEFPLGFSQALWDELTQNDLDSRLLFAAPMTDSFTSDPLLDVLGSQESSVQGTRDADSHGSGSPRRKRRRLFNGTGQAPSNSIDAPFQEILAPFKTGVDSLVSEVEEHENSISLPSIWYKDESLSSPAENLEPIAESWMITCIEDNDSIGCMSHMETATVAETPELWTPKGQPCEEPIFQGPPTPFSSRPSTPGNRLGAMRKLNLSCPVAYPFTIVKPLGTEGDVTLTDINQIIATPPKASPRSQVNTDYARPNINKLESGLGLSGKSVVARTRICTEGNGTITILRTKG